MNLSSISGLLKVFTMTVYCCEVSRGKIMGMVGTSEVKNALTRTIEKRDAHTAY
jgi:hypothetical protein